MEMVDLESVDIKLDNNGQPVIYDGDMGLVYDEKCWIQDLRNEILTEQAELFYEDEDELESYGFGLNEFKNEKYSDFLKLEILQRIKEKLKKRKEIEQNSISIEINIDTGIVMLRVQFKNTVNNEEYTAEISENRVEVVRQ